METNDDNKWIFDNAYECIYISERDGNWFFCKYLSANINKKDSRATKLKKLKESYKYQRHLEQN
jgi:hypothetical protein